MATEMARWTLVGAAIGIVVFTIVLGYMFFFSVPQYTPEEKVQINIGFAVNCSKCLEKENISCSPKELVYSRWGAICGDYYVPKNCSMCREI